MSLYSGRSNTECSNTESYEKIKKITLKKRIVYIDKKEVYEGEVDECDAREGWGIYEYNNGDIYEGKFKSGVKDGKGEYVYADGSYYRGDWKNDKKHGYGTYKFNRLEYDGYWENDEFKEGVVFRINKFESNLAFKNAFLGEGNLDKGDCIYDVFDEFESDVNNEITAKTISDKISFIKQYLDKHDIEIKRVIGKDLFVNKFLGQHSSSEYNHHLPNCISKMNNFNSCLCENIRKFIA
jgi:hypothetical protein